MLKFSEIKRVRFISLLVAAVFFSSDLSFAATYNADCLNAKAKFSSCSVTVNHDRLKIEFKSKTYQDLNVDVSGTHIKFLSAGEYVRRRVGESIAGAILFSPVFLFTLFSKKKRDQIGIEFQDGAIRLKNDQNRSL